MLKVLRLLPLLVAFTLAGCFGGSSHHHATHTAAACPPSTHGPAYRPCGPHAKGWATAPGRLGAAPPGASVPTREMYDSIIVSTVPANPWAAAGYVDGSWPDFSALVSAFPSAHHLSIAPFARDNADCLDDEPGDATPGEAAGWVKRQIALGHKLVCVYTSISQMSTVKSLVAQAGVSLSRVKWWCAWYRYIPGLVGGCDAVQWTDHALGRNLDESTVRADFFGPTGPSDALIRHWRSQRNRAFELYHSHGCKAPQQSVFCTHAAQGVLAYQKALWGVYPRWALFGKRASHLHSAIAWVIRGQANYWTHAKLASQHAFQSHVCGGATGTQGLTKDCRVWKQRANWFGSHATALVEANS